MICHGSYGYEKAWILKIYFLGLEKSWTLGKIAEVVERSLNFIAQFLSEPWYVFRPEALVCS